ncbi:MAG: precorrin-2 C(20)-methyltransferase [Deltaproteobacteria bacterium]|nr:MAG: precorrin-2 C(20)-methyltransferase [Deltaproteobacteria bacterium]
MDNNEKKTGTLFGIGVGPGDPELIPVKAARILGEVDQVFTASSTRNSYSLAVDIARPYIPEETPVETLAFPMSRDLSVKEDAWRQHARRIAGEVGRGRNVAFLTLGDPLTYSTYGYVLRHIQTGWPDLPVVTIPGITSYQAAAAATNRPLVEGEESLLVLSGVDGGKWLDRAAVRPDNVVFMKAYRNIPGICRSLAAVGMDANSMAVANCSRDEEVVYRDLTVLEQQPPNYWTLIIAKQNSHGPKKTT